MVVPDAIIPSVVDHKSYYDEEDSFLFKPFGCASGYVQKRYRVPMHAQNFWEINIVLNGEGTHYIEEQTVSVKPGDVFVIPPNFRHAYYAENDFDVYHIILSEYFFSRYRTELDAIPHFNTLFNIEPAMRSSGYSAFHLTLRTDEFSGLSPLLENLRKYTCCPEGAMPSTRNLIIGSSYALIILAEMCYCYEKRLEESSSEKSLQKDLLFLKSVSEIYNNFGSNLSTDYLASVAGMSRSSYINMFKKIMHTPPGQFVLKYRLEKAREMLVSTNTTVSQIAELCGFYDLSHFEKSFFRAYGISPMSMRNGEEPLRMPEPS